MMTPCPGTQATSSSLLFEPSFLDGMKMGKDLTEIWDKVLGDLATSVGGDGVNIWLKQVTLVGVQGREVFCTVPGQFFMERIKERCALLLKQSFEKHLGCDDVTVQFLLSERQGEADKCPEPFQEKRRGLPARPMGNIDGRYTFESFVVGSSNQFANAASRKVAEQPGQVYNPLFIYSGVGLGKTHLLGAIGNRILTGQSGLRVLYLSAEHFTNDVIHSIRNDRMTDLRNRYRNIDILLIDDIQFLSGKERTQEEFFYTFNTLYEAKKQIVMTSDRATKEIPDIEERLRSRFEMGLIADIQPPDLETRIAILHGKAEAEKIPIPDDVAVLIATHITSNVREMEGALIRLGAFTSLTGQPLNIETARRVLHDTIKEKTAAIRVEDIQEAVAKRFQIKIADLKSKKRTQQIIVPRHIGMYLCRELTNLSLPEIGRYFGGRDHSTVIHACKQVEKAKAEDLSIRTAIQSVIAEIGGARDRRA